METTVASLKQPAFTEHASIRMFGFWVYLMSDCILFITLFATYAVLSSSHAGGPSGKALFDLQRVFFETIFLLCSSFTCSLSILAVRLENRFYVLSWLAATFILGALFITFELHEFYHLISTGNGPDRSAFLSAFFTLVGTHGLHVLIGLLWIAVMIAQVTKKGLTSNTSIRLFLFNLFWHFLDIIWIFIFSIVYLLGIL